MLILVVKENSSRNFNLFVAILSIVLLLNILTIFRVPVPEIINLLIGGLSFAFFGFVIYSFFSTKSTLFFSKIVKSMKKEKWKKYLVFLLVLAYIFTSFLDPSSDFFSLDKLFMFVFLIFIYDYYRYHSKNIKSTKKKLKKEFLRRKTINSLIFLSLSLLIFGYIFISFFINSVFNNPVGIMIEWNFILILFLINLIIIYFIIKKYKKLKK
jgi:hypothetical protein